MPGQVPACTHMCQKLPVPLRCGLAVEHGSGLLLARLVRTGWGPSGEAPLVFGSRQLCRLRAAWSTAAGDC